MTYLNPPYIELGLYYSHEHNTESFKRLFKALIELGATYTGIVQAHKGKDIERKKFGSITDYVLFPVNINENDIINNSIPNGIRIIQANFNTYLQNGRNEKEILTFLSISERSVLIDHHPLSIWAEGDCFSKPTGIGNKEKDSKGLYFYEKLKNIVGSTNPSYASLTVEYGLECPSDLDKHSKSYAFRDFYICSEFAGSSLTSKLKYLLSGAYQEPMSNGIYISTNRFFNPDRVQLGPDISAVLSCRIGRMIGSIRQY